jgi:hypothetical protein
MIDYGFKGVRSLFLLYLRTKDMTACFINIGQEDRRSCYKNRKPVSANGVGNGALYMEQSADIPGSNKQK